MALMELWGINEELQPLGPGSTARVWLTTNAIVKLARDDIHHFNAGLRASQAVEAAGLQAGAPILNRLGNVSIEITVGLDAWMLAVLRQVSGTARSMHEFEPEALGELLGKIHASLRSTDPAGAWAVQDVLDHMKRGILDAQSAPARQMIASSIEAVSDWYRQANPRRQLIRGDGPELLVHDGVVSGMVDWGGVRYGSVADDIGCWTLHGATRSIGDYTREFVRGYTSVSPLSPEEELAIPLFQRLRLASRACYVTDSAALIAIERWMSNI
ncbi:phosphotransferase [Paenibacillus lycopersici]|uniref:Phosphotransferase n=1 Tax=Paenibacillus lycopersici TaxID=2704462 RepID=A0A6C0G011_9BACL|nr:phosphotransferase [Paenibacillus lycopersici]QHT61071.1 phosphotransferase [Paenibacillus lycopersici]